MRTRVPLIQQKLYLQRWEENPSSSSSSRSQQRKIPQWQSPAAATHAFHCRLEWYHFTHNPHANDMEPELEMATKMEMDLKLETKTETETKTGPHHPSTAGERG
ncbi:hypothetical protein M5D96_013583 [Drosophila gunungcola]|uniref:Uncharacterized protein n=1 Tax=Drosophila gunungcola TaxID=103775 RepID=A0A9P9YBS8_9MUSC|nr:hypothetical protein M5D96_013583 [Drosophila gunungcola]